MIQFIIKYYLILVVGLFILSCGGQKDINDPLAKKYNEQTVEQDLQALRDSTYLSKEDEYLIISYLVHKNFQGKKLPGAVTYRELFNNAKAFQMLKDNAVMKKKEQAQKDREAEEKTKEKLNNTIKAAFDVIKLQRVDSLDHFTFKISFVNQSERKIQEVIGKVVLQDIFEEDITNLNVKNVSVIEPGGENVFEVTVKCTHLENQSYGQICDEILECELKWVPEKIIFDDGTIISTTYR